MSTQDRLPGTFRIPSGSQGVTVVGAASALAALQASSDADYIHVGFSNDTLSHAFITGFTNTLSEAQRVKSIRVIYRARIAQTNSYIFPNTIYGYIGTEQVSASLPWTQPSLIDPSVQWLYTPWVARPTDSSRLWSDCDRFEVEWQYYPNGAWDSSNFPYLTYTYASFTYRDRPVVTVSAPTGTVLVPQPAVDWSTTGLELGFYQSSQRIIVVPTGATDTSGRVAGAANFDPATSSVISWDSGRTTSSIFLGGGEAIVGTSLPNGSFYAYVMIWAGTGNSEQTSAWANHSFTVDVDTVDAPTVSIADDAASYTIQVTIAAGAHTADQIADLIEVQYLDSTLGWVAAPITDSVVNGTGTSIFYDGLQTPGATVSYRARGLYAVPASDGQTVSSDWVTATHVVGDLHQHWLRSPSDYTLNRSLHSSSALLLKEWKPSRTRPQAATWGVGARTATVVHDITKGDVHEVTVWAMTRAAYDDLRALVEGDDDIIFVSEWGELWRCQVGDRIDEQIVPAGPRAGETTALGHVRQLSFTLIEVAAP